MCRVIGAGSCLRMVLDRKYRKLNMHHAFFGAVIKVCMGEPYLVAEAIDVNAVIMVLGGYFDCIRRKVFYRVVAPVMAELELVGPAAHRETEYLVSETNSENRF